jgi:hypothetical protein
MQNKLEISCRPIVPCMMDKYVASAELEPGMSRDISLPTSPRMVYAPCPERSPMIGFQASKYFPSSADVRLNSIECSYWPYFVAPHLHINWIPSPVKFLDIKPSTLLYSSPNTISWSSTPILNQSTKIHNPITLKMHSFTMTTFFLLLVALLATPILGDYVERRGYDQKFGELERRTPTPARRRGGSSDSDDDGMLS